MDRIDAYVDQLVSLTECDEARAEEIRAEVRAHIEEMVAERVAAGMEREAAVAESLERFGSAAEIACEFSSVHLEPGVQWSAVLRGLWLPACVSVLLGCLLVLACPFGDPGANLARFARTGDLGAVPMVPLHTYCGWLVWVALMLVCATLAWMSRRRYPWLWGVGFLVACVGVTAGAVRGATYLAWSDEHARFAHGFGADHYSLAGVRAAALALPFMLLLPGLLGRLRKWGAKVGSRRLVVLLLIAVALAAPVGLGSYVGYVVAPWFHFRGIPDDCWTDWHPQSEFGQVALAVTIALAGSFMYDAGRAVDDDTWVVQAALPWQVLKLFACLGAAWAAVQLAGRWSRKPAHTPLLAGGLAASALALAAPLMVLTADLSLVHVLSWLSSAGSQALILGAAAVSIYWADMYVTLPGRRSTSASPTPAAAGPARRPRVAASGAEPGPSARSSALQSRTGVPAAQA